MVLNGECYLKRLLESTKNLVSKTIILDTGSTDNTRSIAESYGVELIYHHLPWSPGIFSEGKNLLLSYVTTPWTLNLDVDEELSEELSNTIRKTVHGTNNLLLAKRLSFVKDGGTIKEYIGVLFKTKEFYFDHSDYHSNVAPKNKAMVAITQEPIYHLGWFFLTEKELQEKRLRYKDNYKEFNNG